MKNSFLSGCLIVCFLGLAFSQSSVVQAQQSSASAASATPAALVLSKELASGGTVVLMMNVGDLHIIQNPDANRLRLEIRGGASLEEERSWIKDFEVAGDRAKIEIHTPKDHEHCVSCDAGGSITIYIPQQTAMKLDVGIGDVTINGIKGDKQVKIGIGDLCIGVGDRKEYDEVNVSTRIGDVSDSVYRGKQQGFLGKSETITRDGRYHLRAHVGIGDLRLIADSPNS